MTDSNTLLVDQHRAYTLLTEQFRASRGSNTIIRNHTTVTNGQPAAYNVGNHIGGCVQTLLLCYPQAKPALVRHTAFHDYPEYATGDVIGSAKTVHPELGKVLTEIENKVEEEYQILKGYSLDDVEALVLGLVDRAELLMWCFEQYSMGCRSPRFLKMLNRVSEKVRDLASQTHGKAHLYKEMVGPHGAWYYEHIIEGTAKLEHVLFELRKELMQ